MAALLRLLLGCCWLELAATAVSTKGLRCSRLRFVISRWDRVQLAWCCRRTRRRALSDAGPHALC